MAHVVFLNSNRAGLQAFEAARHAGHDVSFVGEEDLELFYAGPAFDRARTSLLAYERLPSGSTDEDVRRAVARIDRTRHVDAVLSVLESSAQTAALVARERGLAGPDPEAVALARSKAACRSRLDDAGIPSARYVQTRSVGSAHDFAASVGYPVVAKPARGLASILARRVADEADLRDYFQEFQQVFASNAPGLRASMSEDVLVEEFLDGPLYSVEIGRVGGQLVEYMVTQRKQDAEDPAIELGSTMPADVPAPTWETFVEYASAVLEALGLDNGIFHVEVIHTSAGPRLVEVNPRLMGGTLPALYQHVTGTEIYEYLVQGALGEVPSPPGRSQFRPVTSRFLGARADAVAAGSIDSGWITHADVPVLALDVDVRAGQAVPRMTNSIQGIGTLFTTGASAQESIAFADRAVQQVSAQLGIGLRR